MKRWVVKLLSVLNAIIMIIAALICEANGNRNASITVMMIAIAVAIVLLWFLRCPHCGAWPRRGSFFQRYCPYCGEMLDD